VRLQYDDNLLAASPVREQFSLSVLGNTPQELASYWRDLRFHGTRRPPVVESQRTVLRYMARPPGAVGYVRRALLQESSEVARVNVILPILSGETG
jgi:hypothetical protein